MIQLFIIFLLSKVLLRKKNFLLIGLWWTYPQAWVGCKCRFGTIAKYGTTFLMVLNTTVNTSEPFVHFQFTYVANRVFMRILIHLSEIEPIIDIWEVVSKNYYSIYSFLIFFFLFIFLYIRILNNHIFYFFLVFLG